MDLDATDSSDALELNIDIIKQRSVTGITSFLVRMVFLQIVTFVASIFVSRYLTPFAFGVYGIVASFVLLFTFFSDIGLAAALVQKREKLSREDLTTTFTIQQTLVLILVVLIFIMLPIIQPVLKFNDDGLWLGRALAFSLFLASLKSIPSVLLERKLKFNFLVIPEIAETIIFNGVLVYMAYRGMEVKSFTFAVLARGIIGVIVIYIISPWRLGISFKKDIAKSLVRFGAPFQFNSVLAWFKDSLMDNVVALILQSPSSFGYLSWARNFAYQPKKIMDSVIRVTFPVFSRLQDRKDILGKAMSKTYFLLSVLMFPAITGICVLVKPFILYLFGGSKWLPAIPAVYFLSITLIWGLFNSIATNALSAIGKIKIVLTFMIMVTTATWVLTPIFTYFWGFNGAAFSWVLTGFVSLWSIHKCAQEVEINFIRDMKGAFLASIIMAVVTFALSRFWVQGLTQLIVTVVIGVGVYGIMIYGLEKKRLIQEASNLLGKDFKIPIVSKIINFNKCLE